MTEPPRAEPAAPWMLSLERAHALAHAAAERVREELEPNLYLEPAARALEQGLGAMYDAFDGRADRPTSIALARMRLWDAAVLVARGGLSSALAALRDACEALTSAEERYPELALAVNDAKPLRSSDHLPPLHMLERRSLVPTLRAPPLPPPDADEGVRATPDLPSPTTFDELAAVAARARRLADERIAAALEAVRRPRPKPEANELAPAEPPPGFAHAPGRPLSEDDFVRRWARECIDEIAMLGVQRAPQAGEEWRTCRSLERRMVIALDALAALGTTALRYVEPYVCDAPVADPMKMFAIAMIGGCFDGRDALAAAERVLHRFGPGDPTIAAAFASAMKLATNPFVANAMRTLVASERAECRAIGVEVLAHRGWLTAEELGALADDEDPRILALVLPALAAERARDLERALARALAHPELSVREAALDAMALAAHPRAASAAREAACGELGDRALVRLALVGDENDARWLLARMQASPSEAAIEAVGWAGLVDAVPALIGFLEADGQEKEIACAAGAALERILGANLVDRVRVFPEETEEVEVRDPDPEPLAKRVSDPRDEPPAGSPETLEVPSVDPARWRAYWVEHRAKYDPKARLRRGQPYSPAVSLYELDRLPLGVEDRRRLHRELVARTGRRRRFSTEDLVVVQERSLADWAQVLAREGHVAGAWETRRRAGSPDPVS